MSDSRESRGKLLLMDLDDILNNFEVPFNAVFSRYSNGDQLLYRTIHKITRRLCVFKPRFSL